MKVQEKKASLFFSFLTIWLKSELWKVASMLEEPHSKNTLKIWSLFASIEAAWWTIGYYSHVWLKYGHFLVFDKFSNVTFIRWINPHHSQYLTPSRKQNLQFCTQSINVPHTLNIYCSESCKSQRAYPNSTAPEM